jgi:hypothetical protein
VHRVLAGTRFVLSLNFYPTNGGEPDPHKRGADYKEAEEWRWARVQAAASERARQSTGALWGRRVLPAVLAALLALPWLLGRPAFGPAPPPRAELKED